MQVDFYQLAGTPAEQVIASLAEKVLDADGRLLIIADDEGQLARLDRMLWDQGSASFLPHGIAECPDRIRIELRADATTDLANCLLWCSPHAIGTIRR